MEPSLAVELRMLDFVSRLFVHVPPNNTAWCKTIEDFLSNQGYKLTTPVGVLPHFVRVCTQYSQDSLRRRFSNALQWYNMLQDITEKHVDDQLADARVELTGYRDGTLETERNELIEDEGREPGGAVMASEVIESESSSPCVGEKRALSSDSDEDVEDVHEDEVFPPPLKRDRPSDYLRLRCPLCFGGEFPRSNANSQTPDAIVCIDACFTQKRNKGSRDPIRIHPKSVFVPESDADRTAHYVESIRPPRPAKSKRQRNQDKEDKDDGFEGSLRVPTSVLDACEAGFTAADDARVKASTQFFDDTALMAMLCRHDRVLWIVNMRSAGEKQHYVLVLIETLFQHLPLEFTIGLLYDIGCQLERSCINWGFLARYLHRLLFGISVFHAFGHQWACQVIYHPRKRIGFGLSDGEGCERFWHSISKLIAYLRVCGYHQRIYTLDRQVQQFDKDSLEKLGNWLQRRSCHCSNKRDAAKLLLTEASQSDECLRREWAAQVAAQTRPAPKRSKNKGKLAVEKALNLRKARDILEKRVSDQENIILGGDVDVAEV
ncbi:hypothetical protein H0H93_009716, partial [Arthromyces matolae]